MILKRDCKCGQSIEFEAEDLPGLSCPHCGASLQEQFAKQKAYAGPRRAEEIRTNPRTIEQTALQSVRAGTCYPALRGLINVAVGIGYGFCALLAIGLILSLAPWIADAFTTGNRMELFGIFASAGAIILAVIFLAAIRQALFVVIDIADVAIADRADRIQADTKSAYGI